MCSSLASSQRFRWLSLLNGASDYVENIACTAACAAHDPLTFSVIDMLRRFIVIVVCGVGALTAIIEAMMLQPLFLCTYAPELTLVVTLGLRAAFPMVASISVAAVSVWVHSAHSAALRPL